MNWNFIQLKIFPLHLNCAYHTETLCVSLENVRENVSGVCWKCEKRQNQARYVNTIDSHAAMYWMLYVQIAEVEKFIFWLAERERAPNYYHCIYTEEKNHIVAHRKQIFFFYSFPVSIPVEMWEIKLENSQHVTQRWRCVQLPMVCFCFYLTSVGILFKPKGCTKLKRCVFDFKSLLSPTYLLLVFSPVFTQFFRWKTNIIIKI